MGNVGLFFFFCFFYFLRNLLCGKMTLKETFLVLYGIAHEKDAFVAAHLDFSSDSIK